MAHLNLTVRKATTLSSTFRKVTHLKLAGALKNNVIHLFKVAAISLGSAGFYWR